MSSRWVTKRALGLHLTLAIVLAAFGALTWWQVGRAISGNTLSYVYSFEWPLFAAYAVYLWWKLVHEPATRQGQSGAEAGSGDTAPLAAPAAGDELTTGGSCPADGRHLDAPGEPQQAPVDDELAAYNRYLAELARSGARKQLFSGRRTRGKSSKKEIS